jgi:transposase
MSKKNNSNDSNDNNINTKDPMYRISLMEKYIERKITAKKIANIFNVKIRQIWYLIKDYREECKLSLVHKLTNKPTNHSLGKELKKKVTELINQEKYKDFGLTLLSEYLNKYEHIDINHETLT